MLGHAARIDRAVLNATGSQMSSGFPDNPFGGGMDLDH
jgi:hypothetical protein